MDKTASRKLAAATAAKLTSEYREEASLAIQGKLLADPDYQSATCVLTYISTENEVGTNLIVNDCIKRGTKLCVPLCMDTQGDNSSGKEHRMCAIEISSVSELQPGAYGILEPFRWRGEGEDPRLVKPENIDYVVCPCVACDLEGNRLGHGAGYYDRWLARYRGKKVALCFGEMLQDEIPTNENDVRMDEVITER